MGLYLLTELVVFEESLSMLREPLIGALKTSALCDLVSPFTKTPIKVVFFFFLGLVQNRFPIFSRGHA